MRQHTGYGCRKRNREIPERNFLWDLCMISGLALQKMIQKPPNGTGLPRNKEIPEYKFLWDLCMTLDMEFKKTTLKPSSGTDLPPKRDIPRQIQVYMLGRKGCSGII